MPGGMPSDLPDWGIVLYVLGVIFLSLVIWTVPRWRKLAGSEAKRSAEYTIYSGSLADLKPVRQLNETVGRLADEQGRAADELAAIRHIMQEQAVDNEVDRRVRERLERERRRGDG